MRLSTALLASILAVYLGWAGAAANAATIVISVGPGGQYQTINDAVTAANGDPDPGNHYVINVVPATYVNDFAEVTRPMTIRTDPAFPSQRAILKATVPLPNEKGIILTFARLHVRGLVFEGARIANSLGGNGAGIRDQQTAPGARLVVENSIFRHNQEGILQGNDLDETIIIVNSRFVNNGNPDADYFQHAVYVNQAASLSVTNSLFCGQLIGHNVKSRAMVTTVSNNRIYDGAAGPAPCRIGSSSYAIDVPNGGIATISGNELVQGADSPNRSMIDYGGEGLSYSENSLVVTSNDFVNTGGSAIGIFDAGCVPAQLSGNTFSGVDTPVYPPQCETPLAP